MRVCPSDFAMADDKHGILTCKVAHAWLDLFANNQVREVRNLDGRSSELPLASRSEESDPPDAGVSPQQQLQKSHGVCLSDPVSLVIRVIG